MTASLAIADLRVSAGAAMLLRDVSLIVEPGVPVTILGETGSGKTLVAEAAMGTLAPELGVSGTVAIDGSRSAAEDRGARRGLWGRRLAMLPQEPWLALDPTMRALPQVAEGYRLLRGLPWGAAKKQARDDLAALGLADAARHHPHQLSGGMAQRVAFAAARAGGASFLLADEPTKGLDAAMRDAVVALLRRAVDAGGSLLCITHDIAVPRALGGEVVVMLGGDVVERGPAESVLGAPEHPYTRRLVGAEPAAWPEPTHARAGATILAGRGLTVTRGRRLLFENLGASVGEGEWLAVTGPSGCGKTTLGDVLLGLARPEKGAVSRRPGLARTRFQKLYQDPVATFPPRSSLRTALSDAARLHRMTWSRVEEQIARLGIAGSLLDRRPDQVSGGELQRVAIARTLTADPVFLFADEPTSRLDPITQQETLNALRDVAAARGCAVMLVTHDLALARKAASRTIAIGP